MYDRTTIYGATFKMRGQMYREHTNATTLSSSPVHWAQSRTTRLLVLAGARRGNVRKKKCELRF